MAALASPAIVVLGPGGLNVARRAASVLPGATIHGLERRVADVDIPFDDVAGHLREVFRDGMPIVGVCAAGVLIRALAPVLGDKVEEPPVIVLAEDGSAVVPLLGGHRGANDIARSLAAEFGVAPALTTAGDLRFGIALDDPPPGWVLANPEDAKPFMADMLAGETIRIEGEAPFLTDAGIVSDFAGPLRITVTERASLGNRKHLVYHPKSVAVGVGCERGATAGELLDVVNQAFAGSGLAKPAVAGIFSLDLKSDERAIHVLAGGYDGRARFFDAGTLEAETPRLENPSDAVFKAVGCHGVAEAAALAAAGPDGKLVVAKTRGSRATCAIAMAPGPIDAASVGRARGWLGIVGTGPGARGWLTPEAAAMLGRAADVVGYGPYLDLVAARIAGKTRHEFALGEEERRARTALDLAAEGRAVALVSSGDPGIYAMASVAYELIDREERPDWRRIEIETAPGISALQAAAARAGAPLGHDFCVLSLSDLLTPWETIERRIEAAATGDFALAIYNPASKRRDWQLARAREILLAHRPETTPVVLARNLGRDGETVRVTTLGGLAVDEVDMLTILLIGATTTRAVQKSDGGAWVYTPRGYASKAPETES